MKIILAGVGKSHDALLARAIDDYTARIAHYHPVQWEVIPGLRPGGKSGGEEWRKQESAAALARIKAGDRLILLDERGKNLSSPELASVIGDAALQSAKRLVFLIGGAFGVDQSVRQRADLCWSLSRLVYPHMIVRLVLAEQVYRACTILRNEKYHHE